jgi:ribosomal protein S18 acetylase RimI-like enzyme
MEVVSMPLVFRPARADELQRAEELVVRSINDLTGRHGFGPMATLRPPDFQLFSLNDDPDGLWVAEVDGEIIGFALSWVCGDLWFLAELFVAPGHQGGGVGNELLARTFEHAKKAGATNKSLITFTFNVASQGLYIRHGLFPRLPIYFFGVAQAHGIGAAFKTALDLAAMSGAAQVSAFLPGVSQAVGIAVEHGMRITFPMVLVSMREFGDWTRYLPRNPGFM